MSDKEEQIQRAKLAEQVSHLNSFETGLLKEQFNLPKILSEIVTGLISAIYFAKPHFLFFFWGQSLKSF